MSIVITDQSLLQQFASASGIVEIRDASGTFLGTFARESRKDTQVRSPFTLEEIERRRLEPDGRTLSEILPGTMEREIL